MSRLILTSVIMFVISFGQILGQTTTTTTTTTKMVKTETTTPVSQSPKQSGKTAIITQTVTISPNGDSTVTVTRTTTASMKASLGIKANVGPSDFIIRDMPDCRSNMDFSMLAGGFLKLETHGGFALQYELLIRYRSPVMEDTVLQTRTNYQYWGLELPIYIMGQIRTKAGKIFIGAGPYVGFGIDAKQAPGNVNLYRKDNTTGKAVMHRWDFGLGTMLGFEFNNGISLNAGCYQGGLINVLSAEKHNRSMKNQAVNFGIGYKF